MKNIGETLLIKSPAHEKAVIANCAYLGLGLLILDQATKLLVVRFLDRNDKISVIPNGIFNLVHVRNKGAAWGMFSEHPWILFIVSVIVFAFIAFRIRRLAEGRAERYFSMAMIMSGIAGNLTDRLLRGSVVDFIDWDFPDIKLGSFAMERWPSFNIADSAICVGVIVFIISSWIYPSIKEEPASKPENTNPEQKPADGSQP